MLVMTAVCGAVMLCSLTISTTWYFNFDFCSGFHCVHCFMMIYQKWCVIVNMMGFEQLNIKLSCDLRPSWTPDVFIFTVTDKVVVPVTEKMTENRTALIMKE